MNKPVAEKPAAATPKKHPPDGTRETIESIAMAIILALIFRSFVAEAFVIPTGSMAPTLVGRHKDVACPQCGHWHQIGASNESTADGSPTGVHVIGTTCPVCRHAQTLNLYREPNQGSFSGDRIIVSKFAYDLRDPRRWDVIVFKYPGHARDNYIKRLVGLPGETLKVVGGNVYTKPLGAADTEYRIARKPPDKLNALLQLVHDTDFLAKDLTKRGWPSFWHDPNQPADAKAGWEKLEHGKAYRCAAKDDAPHWLRYRHLFPSIHDWEDDILDKERLPADIAERPAGIVTDMYAYNAGFWITTGRPDIAPGDYDPEDSIGKISGKDFHPEALGMHWVDDLAVDCSVTVENASGEVGLELVRAGHRYRCWINVADGQARLEIVDPTGSTVPFQDDAGRAAPQPVATTAVRGPGTYQLRLSNVDHQLLLWVNGEAVTFPSTTTYASPELVAPQWSRDDAGDTEPAAVAVKGAHATVRKLRIFRDKYYIAASHELGREDDDYARPLADRDEAGRITEILGDPRLWNETGIFEHRRSVVFDIPADSFFPMGDNSPYSKDARLWAEPYSTPPVPSYVKRDLLVGKALMVYWPHSWNRPFGWPNFRRMGWIR